MNELFEAYCEDNDDDITSSSSRLKTLTSTHVAREQNAGSTKTATATDKSNACKTLHVANLEVECKSERKESVDESGVNESVDESQVDESVNQSQISAVDDQPINGQQFQYPGHIPPLK